MNGCVGGALPGEGRAAERSITAPGRGARLLRSPPPPTLAPPGARSSASLGLWGHSGGGPGAGARRGRPSAAGEPEVRSRLEAPDPLFFVWAWSSAVSGPRPASAGSPRRALLGCSRISEPWVPANPQPVGVFSARSGPPNPVPLGPRGWPGPGSPNCVSGADGGVGWGRDAGPRVSAFSPPPPLVSLRPDPSASCSCLKRLFCGGAVPDATRTPPPPPKPGLGPARRTLPRQPHTRPPAGAPPPCTGPPPLQPQPHANKPPRRHDTPETHSGPRRQAHKHTTSRRHGPHRRSPAPLDKQSHTNNPTQAPHHSVPLRPRSTFTSSPQAPKPRDSHTEDRPETHSHTDTHTGPSAQPGAHPRARKSLGKY